MFKKSKIYEGVLLLVSAATWLAAPAFAQEQQLERVEVTGSRIKRVDAEGSLPVTVITRADLESSGATTVAEFVRTLTFASNGNFRPQSGSTAQSFSSVDLRGLGQARTLVLLDGRRVAKSPNVGDAADMNSIPMAAVERVEILTDGASAVYGSDAIGGVVNFVTRKDFNGGEVMVGVTRPKNDGGDREEASALMGLSNAEGSMLLGISHTRREMVYTRQRPWGTELGVSKYGNNYQFADGTVTAVPGGCTDENFYLQANGRCSYNFNAVAADEAALKTTSVFTRAERKINDVWSAYAQASVTNNKSFGRYAPTPGAVTIAANTPNNPTDEEVTLLHRFAAAGNRDTTTDNNLYDVFGGVTGTLGEWDIDTGARYTKSKYTELGRNYIVTSLAEAAINNGTYNIYNPSSNSETVLKSISATISRDSDWTQKEVYINASRSLFRMKGGSASLALGGEWRKEDYADLYDSLSEAGEIMGSSGNSAGGSRTVKSLYGELLLPFSKTFDVDLAARYEKYSDYGSDFSPKASANWKVLDNLKLRGSVGKGFRAPSLPTLTQKTAFSAESVKDQVTCVVQGYDAADCADDTSQPQVDTYYHSNSDLKSEKSTQFSFGLVFDATQWMSLKADYWNIKIDDAITQLSAQDIIDRDNGTDTRAIPYGLGVTRGVNGDITRVDAGYVNEGTWKVSGLDFNVLLNYKIGFLGKLRHDLTWSHRLKQNENGTEKNGDIGYPKDRITLANGLNRGPLDFQWNVNVIGKNGASSSNDRVGTYTTHDLQASWTTGWKGKFTVGLVNAFDKFPQLVDYDGRNFNYNLYDSYGRQLMMRYNQKF
jgi:iron complex outermembrane recepter protein